MTHRYETREQENHCLDRRLQQAIYYRYDQLKLEACLRHTIQVNNGNSIKTRLTAPTKRKKLKNSI